MQNGRVSLKKTTVVVQVLHKEHFVTLAIAVAVAQTQEVVAIVYICGESVLMLNSLWQNIKKP